MTRQKTGGNADFSVSTFIFMSSFVGTSRHFARIAWKTSGYSRGFAAPPPFVYFRPWRHDIDTISRALNVTSCNSIISPFNNRIVLLKAMILAYKFVNVSQDKYVWLKTIYRYILIFFGPWTRSCFDAVKRSWGLIRRTTNPN